MSWSLESGLCGGFAISQQSAAELGTAYAGSAAAAEDAGTIADNPAGLSRLGRPELTVSGTLIDPSLPFTNSGASRVATGVPNLGGNENGAGAAPIPSFFVSYPFEEGVTVGFGVFPSFGLVTDYKSDWVGRYEAQTTRLTSIDFAPTISYRVNTNFSVGLSPVLRYSKVTFSNAIDFGSLGAGLGIPGSVSGAQDGSVKIQASDLSSGVNTGILIEPADNTRIGVAYFYSATAKLSGPANFTLSPVGNLISAASGSFVDTSAAASLAYPSHVSIGVVQGLLQGLDLRAGLTWTQWSRFKALSITFENAKQPDAVTSDNWRDTLSCALGVTYQLNPDWVFRTGIMYDQTPVPDAFHRTPRLPDANRIAPAFGAGYRMSDSTNLDLAYQHIFGGTVPINVASASGDTLIGKTSVSANVFSLQLTAKF
jgi:long-chain fatty acid transport protein